MLMNAHQKSTDLLSRAENQAQLLKG